MSNSSTTPASLTLRGVTLIEMLVVMAIFPLVLLALTFVFVTISEGSARTAEQASLDQEQQFILSRIKYDFTRASRLLQPAAPGATHSGLTLETAQGAVQYQLVGGRLQRSDTAGNAFVSSGRVRVAGLLVTRLGSPSGTPTARLTIDLESSSSGRLQERSIVSTLGLRTKP